jgi:phosphatidylglycerophosphatase A
VSRPTARVVFADPVHFLAFGFGAGLAPRAPGTWGTLVAVPIWVALASLDMPLRVVAVVAVCLAGFWLCGESARRLGEHDHPGIVWDEIAGYLLTMLAAPAGWIWVVAGFCLFRLFDIWKPWPIRELDRGLSGGIGIMMDDLVAGVFAAAVMLVAGYWTGV